MSTHAPDDAIPARLLADVYARWIASLGGGLSPNVTDMLFVAFVVGASTVLTAIANRIADAREGRDEASAVERLTRTLDAMTLLSAEITTTRAMLAAKHGVGRH